MNRRASMTRGVSVLTTMPSSTAEAQAGRRKSRRAAVVTSTWHRRQAPAGLSFSWWHRCGMWMPARKAASSTVVPGRTEIGVPSTVSEMCFM
jgi:hypothetical protein